MKEENNLIFTYGTLKSQYSNHRVMKNAGGRFVGNATLSGATMYSLGAFPAIVVDGSENLIYGEVYEVDDFRPLDYLEGTPDFYQRKIVNTSLGLTWVYYLTKEQVKNCKIIKSGDWK